MKLIAAIVVLLITCEYFADDKQCYDIHTVHQPGVKHYCIHKQN